MFALPVEPEEFWDDGAQVVVWDWETQEKGEAGNQVDLLYCSAFDC